MTRIALNFLKVGDIEMVGTMVKDLEKSLLDKIAMQNEVPHTSLRK